MRQPRIKYKEYGTIWDRKLRRGGHARTLPIFGTGGTTFGKYISKWDDATNRYVIDDEESKTTYKLGLGERRAFGDAHRDFGISIQEWYESLNKKTQDRIIRIPLDNKIKEEKEATECQH
jgi:hypothetical protein